MRTTRIILGTLFLEAALVLGAISIFAHPKEMAVATCLLDLAMALFIFLNPNVSREGQGIRKFILLTLCVSASFLIAVLATANFTYNADPNALAYILTAVALAGNIASLFILFYYRFHFKHYQKAGYLAYFFIVMAQIFFASYIGIFNFVHFSCLSPTELLVRALNNPCGYANTPFFWIWSPGITGIDTANLQIVADIGFSVLGFIAIPFFAVVDAFKKKAKSERAFTLIELLITVAVISILSVAVVGFINPAELFRQGRDATRVSDLAAINSALAFYAQDTAGSLGTPFTTYISIPDPKATTTAGTDCAGIGFPGGGYFHCAASSTFRSVNGKGWIPLNFTSITGGSVLSSLPVDPTNQSSSDLYYSYQTDGSSFKVIALPESQKYVMQTGANPLLFRSGSNQALGGGAGWVLVPANPIFGTPNFWVMKYAAVCSDGKGKYLNDYETNVGWQTYDDSSKPCIAANGRQAASLPGGWPIANIKQATAANYCSAVGGHLLSNKEWQTIAWSAENVASNWSGGTVGSGSLYSGHNDSNPTNAIPADINDQNGYAGEINIGGNQKRTLTLSDGALIWDMSGNVYQWTSDTVSSKPGGNLYSYYEFPYVNYQYSDLTAQTGGPANSTWSSAQGIGDYFQGAPSGGPYSLLRGSSWSMGSDAGIESLDLSNYPNYTVGTVGFRCAR